jgi:hypothetical protein
MGIGLDDPLDRHRESRGTRTAAHARYRGGGDQTVRLWNLATRELIASLFRGSDGEWVMWSPQGYYVSSPNGDSIVGWQINKGYDQAADYVSARQLKSHFYRPAVVERSITVGSAKDAVEEARKRDPGSAPFDLDILLSRKTPNLSIVTPADNARIAAATAEIGIDIGDVADPINRIDVFVNGAQITPPDTRGLIPVAAGSRARKITVPLSQGENRITIRGYNLVGATERELTLIGTAAGSLERKGKLFVIAIGVDRYPHLQGRCNGQKGSCDLL